VCDDDEDDELLRENPRPICLTSFEPSNTTMTIAQCLGTVIHTMAAARVGCGVRIIIADTLALLNGDKLGGNWVRVRVTARRNVMKLEAALKAVDVGVGISEGGKVEFHWSSHEILHCRAAEYWPARHGRCPKVLHPEGTRRDRRS
jgi:hypothetical protein